ncbi:MAG: class I SAM-dependent methyltransferase [Pseudomonadota bacterium]
MAKTKETTGTDRKGPGLESAYALESVADVEKLYAAWAVSYDGDFAQRQGYRLPEEVARGYATAGGEGPILDVGAGTGLVGEALGALGRGPVHGTDISAEMLQIAETKGCYAKTFRADITQPLAIADGTYGGIVSAGTFTLGHLGPDPLSELIRIVRPGGLFVIAVNEAHWRAAGFAKAFAGFGPRITGLSFEPVAIYARGALHDHAKDMGRLVTFRTSQS